jgi:hypothetical protein
MMQNKLGLQESDLLLVGVLVELLEKVETDMTIFLEI